MHVLTCRTSGEGECEASEGSLMCEDMLRAGYQEFIVDPGVRQGLPFPVSCCWKRHTEKVLSMASFFALRATQNLGNLGCSRQRQ